MTFWWTFLHLSLRTMSVDYSIHSPSTHAPVNGARLPKPPLSMRGADSDLRNHPAASRRCHAEAHPTIGEYRR